MIFLRLILSIRTPPKGIRSMYGNISTANTLPRIREDPVKSYANQGSESLYMLVPNLDNNNPNNSNENWGFQWLSALTVSAGLTTTIPPAETVHEYFKYKKTAIL
jgi:hypothetical protein